MPTISFQLQCPVHDSFGVRQIAGMFDCPPGPFRTEALHAELPDASEPWEIGAIVGPSGSGKSALARYAFGSACHDPRPWPSQRAVIDCLGDHPIKEIIRVLASVGFSSPPSWLKPHAVLSNGEKFRVELARALLTRLSSISKGRCADLAPFGSNIQTNSIESAGPISKHPILVFDEFTSVVDRTVARTTATALSRGIRRGAIPIRFVAVTCHEDMLRWLEPDWILDMSGPGLHRGRVRRPPIRLRICRTTPGTWKLFKRHHYLSGAMHPSAACFLATVDHHPAAFAAVLPFPHPRRPGWREHRTVCLPDFQGIGIGTALSDFVAGVYAATGKPYFSTTGHPAMIAHRLQSPLWRMHRPPGFAARPGRSSGNTTATPDTCSRGRITAGFEYIGPARPRQARRLMNFT